jgi:hypothetical protein
LELATKRADGDCPVPRRAWIYSIGSKQSLESQLDGCQGVVHQALLFSMLKSNVHHNVCFLKNDVVAMIRNGDAASADSSPKANQIIFSTFTVSSRHGFSGVAIISNSRNRIMRIVCSRA